MAPSARDPIAVVAPAVSRAEALARCSDLGGKIRDGEALVERTQSALAAWRQEMGKALIALRATFGARGDGFVDCVEKEAGVPHASAQRYMEAAGYVARPNAPIKPTVGLIEPTRPAAPRVVLAPRAANLPTPAPAPRPAPERKEQPRVVRDAEEGPPEEPVYVLDEGATRAPPSRIAQAPAAVPPRQLSFGWAEAAAVAKKECRGMGAQAVAELVADLCERTPGLRELLRRQLAGGAS